MWVLPQLKGATEFKIAKGRPLDGPFLFVEVFLRKRLFENSNARRGRRIRRALSIGKTGDWRENRLSTAEHGRRSMPFAVTSALLCCYNKHKRSAHIFEGHMRMTAMQQGHS